jgi:hypothetical protein
VAIQPTGSAYARELALLEARGHPGILQADLAERLQLATGLARSTAVRLLRGLEREGRLEGRLVGRRKAYELAVPRGRAWEPAAVLVALLTLAAIVALFLTPAGASP